MFYFMFKMLKYLPYLALIEQIVDAFKAIRQGTKVAAFIPFRTGGKRYRITVESE